MKTIFKYSLEGPYAHEMPIGAKILSFQNQGGVLCMWAEVDPHAAKENRYFEVIGTGQHVADDRAYIGTAQQGAYVWHLYEHTP